MSVNKKNEIRYYFYSKEQENVIKNLEEQCGKKYMQKYIIVNGKKFIITEVRKSNDSGFSDAKLVAQGDYTVNIAR